MKWLIKLLAGWFDLEVREKSAALPDAEQDPWSGLSMEEKVARDLEFEAACRQLYEAGLPFMLEANFEIDVDCEGYSFPSDQTWAVAWINRYGSCYHCFAPQPRDAPVSFAMYPSFTPGFNGAKRAYSYREFRDLYPLAPDPLAALRERVEAHRIRQKLLEEQRKSERRNKPIRL